MEDPKQQIVERLKQATNVLVTVSANPSVDQLAAAMGFTLLLNKLGKHGTAVFSGEVPSILEFLEPEKTLEKNTDSLRDFIIALDKSKADKLRYKVEDSHVRIFITPYRTSITDKDLEFSQGDFNVDVVVALGVLDPKDLDQAITAHGRILHDATVISLSTQAPSSLGSINWTDNAASSLSEMLVGLGEQMGQNLMDDQMATAFLTGIVAETDRFSNAKTSAVTMSVSAKLMAAGANQQLVATKLQEGAAAPAEEPKPEETPAPPAEMSTQAKLDELANQVPEEKPAEEKPEEEKSEADGTLDINHGEPKAETESEFGLDAGEETEEDPVDQIHIDDQGKLQRTEDMLAAEAAQKAAEATANVSDGSKLILDPPTLGGTLTANAQVAGLDPSTDPLSTPPADGPLLSHDTPPATTDAAPELPEPVVPDASAPLMPTSAFPPEVTNPDPAPTAPAEEPNFVAAPPAEAAEVEQSLADLEKTVHKEAATPAAPEPVESDARSAVEAALQSGPRRIEPITALNAQPIDLNAIAPPAGDTPATPVADLLPPMPAAPSADSLVAPEPTVVVPSGAPAPDVELPKLEDMALPPSLVPPEPTTPIDPTASPVVDPTAPPPVPPPMLPPLPDVPAADQTTPPPAA